jgi:hypothetical protein
VIWRLKRQFPHCRLHLLLTKRVRSSPQKRCQAVRHTGPLSSDERAQFDSRILKPAPVRLELGDPFICRLSKIILGLTVEWNQNNNIRFIWGESCLGPIDSVLLYSTSTSTQIKRLSLLARSGCICTASMIAFSTD